MRHFTLPSRRGRKPLHNRSRDHRIRLHPFLEQLEDRRMLAVFVVDSLSDSVSDDDEAFTLREAIQLAHIRPGPDTIKFAPQLFGQTIRLTAFDQANRHTTGELTIEDDVWIDGPGSGLLTIDATGGSRIFRAQKSDVKLSGLTLTGGLAVDDANFDGNGGAVYNHAGRLTLDDVVVTGSTAQIHGGGIYSVSDDDDIATLIISNSIISGNNTTTGDGAGIYNLRGDVQITDTAISKNLANPNSSSSDGGGLMSVEGQTLIRRSIVAANEAGAVGGGVVILDGAARIIESTIGGAEDDGNIATTDGGGLAAAGADVFIYASTLSNNDADKRGAGIFAGPRGAKTTTLLVANSTISGNQSLTSGGGIFAQASQSVEIYASTIAENQAQDGGGVYAGDEDLQLHNTIVADNSAQGAPNDIFGTVSDESSFNLIGDGDSAGGLVNDPDGEEENPKFNQHNDPQLDLLAYYGGPTQTHRLGTESPALNAGSRFNLVLSSGVHVDFDADFRANFRSATDQRGVSRYAKDIGGPVDIGAFELDRTISGNSGSQSFQVNNHSQFGAGDATVGDDIFLGLEVEDVDLAPFTLGGFTSLLGKTGLKMTVDPSRMRFGVAAGYSLNRGGIDAAYDAELEYSFMDPDAFMDVRIHADVAYANGSFATSPPSFGAYLDLVAELGADIDFEACALGFCFADSLPVNVNLGEELLAVNRGNDGDLRLLGDSVLPEFSNVEVGGGTLVRKPQRIDYTITVNQCSSNLNALGCRASIDLQPKNKNGDDRGPSFELGEAALKIPQLDSIVDNTLDSSGQLFGMTIGKDDDDDDETWQNTDIDDLPSSFVAGASLQVGALISNVLTENKIDLGDYATLSFTPLSLTMGPEMHAVQRAMVEPVNQITYHFDRPVTVKVGGDAGTTQKDVRQVTVSSEFFNAFDISFEGNIVEVTPEWHFGLNLHNEIDLETTLGGDLTILDIGIDVHDDAILEALDFFGIDPEDLNPEPVFFKRLGELSLPSIKVLDVVVPILRDSRMLAPFKLGESFEPSLTVARRDDQGAGSLRNAVLSANCLSDPMCGESENDEPHVIRLDAGSYLLDLSNAGNPDIQGDLDIKSDITIVGAGSDQTFITASGLFDRIFDVHPEASLNLVGVTLVNGSPDVNHGELNQGGSIRNQGSLTLEDVVIRNASTDASLIGLGGAIYNAAGAVLEMTESAIHDSAAYSGGAIYNAGTATITSSTIGAGGLAENKVGHPDKGDAFLTSCTTALCNRADDAGGGIYNAADATLTLHSSTLADNVAQYGGGVYNLGQLTVDGSTFTANNAIGDAGEQGGRTGDGGGGGGAGVGAGLFNAGTVAIGNSTFSLNRAVGGDGGRAGSGQGSASGGDGGGRDGGKGAATAGANTGGIGGDYSGGGGGTPFPARDTFLIGGRGGFGGGGGGAPDDGTGALGGPFGGKGGNSPASSINGGAGGGGAGIGGAIFQKSGLLIASYLTIAENMTSGGKTGLGPNPGADGQGAGGGIYIFDGEVNVANSILAVNSGDVDPNSNVDDLSAGNNLVAASAASAGLAPLGDYGGPTFTHILLPGSVAIGAGNGNPPVRTDQRGFERLQDDLGAVGFTPNEITVTPDGGFGSFSLRQAITVFNAQGNVDTDGDGDLSDEVNTIHLQPGEYVLTKADFRSAADSAQQGDLDVANQRLVILGAGAEQTIIDASAIQDRALDVHAGATLTIEGVAIRGGKAPSGESGGGIRNAGTLTLNQVLVAGNEATTGGGVFSDAGAELTIAGAMIRDNRSQWGGGIHNLGVLQISSSSIIANEALGADGQDGRRNIVDGGGEGGGGGGAGAGLGGGLFNDGGNVTITNATIALNQATGGRGGDGVDNQQRRPYSDGGDGGGPSAGLGGTIRFETRPAEDGDFGSGGGGGNSAFHDQPHHNEPGIGGAGGFGGGGGGGGANTANADGGDGGNGGDGGDGGQHAGTGGQGTRRPDSTGNPAVSFSNASAGGGGGGGGGIGGAIFSRGGQIVILNGTIYENAATGGAGGVGGGDAEAGENGKGVGGGIYRHSEPASTSVRISNTIVAANQAEESLDVFGQFGNSQGNLIGDATGSSGFSPDENQLGSAAAAIKPLLTALRSDGGLTLFAEPEPNSPAINRGDSSLLVNVPFDQRGDVRIKQGDVDVGAVEVVGVIQEFNAAELNDVLGQPSLRQLIIDANAIPGPQTIHLLEGTYTLTLGTDGDDDGATEGDLDVLDELTIIGAGAGLTIIDASALGDRIFDVSSGTRFILSDMTLTGGSASDDHGGALLNKGDTQLERVEIKNSSAAIGGAIYSERNSNLEILSSTLHGNSSSQHSGAVYNNGRLTLANSTLSSNTSSLFAGALRNNFIADIINSTIVNNQALFQPGIHNLNANGIRLQNSLLANNTTFEGAEGGDIVGKVLSLGNNLVGNPRGACTSVDDDPCSFIETDILDIDPRLGPLTDNGGPTPTHLPLPDSPVIDAGNNAGVALDSQGEVLPDQHGNQRVISTVDIGAVELLAITVETLADGLEPGTLRRAIRDTNSLAGHDTITLGPGVYQLSLAGADEDAGLSGDLDILDDLTIIGAGADQTIIDATGLGDRVFDVLAGANFLLSGVTVRGGDTAGNGGGLRNQATTTLEEVRFTENTAAIGGAIYSDRNWSLKILSSTLHGNSASEHSGAVYNNGRLTLANSTLSANTASLFAGALRNNFIADVINSTIVNNQAAFQPGIHNQNANGVRLQNSLVANNTPLDGDESVGDIVGKVLSLGNNLIGNPQGACTSVDDEPCSFIETDIIGVDPRLGPLADNGGSTWTHALLSDSPAIDAGDPASAEDVDQRGIVRDQGPPDIGAFERVKDLDLPLPGGDSDVQVAELPDGSIDLIVSGDRSLQKQFAAPDSSLRIRTNAGRNTVDLTSAPAAVPLFVETGDEDDVILVKSAAFSQLDGGKGYDIVRLIGSGIHFHLPDMPADSLLSVEELDIVGNGPNELTLTADRALQMTDENNVLRIRHEDEDTVNYSSDWTVERPELIDGQYLHVLRGNGAVLNVANAKSWQNPLNNLDSNRDGFIAPIDVLVVINDLTSHGSRALQTPISTDQLPDFYIDVNGDGFVSPLDALVAINYLNSTFSGNGEGDAVTANVEGHPVRTALQQPFAIGRAPADATRTARRPQRQVADALFAQLTDRLRIPMSMVPSSSQIPAVRIEDRAEPSANRDPRLQLELCMELEELLDQLAEDIATSSQRSGPQSTTRPVRLGW